MDEEEKKRAVRAWKLRKPDYGVLSFHCPATGETFLAATNDTKRGFNRHTFQLKMGGHPNKRLQALWNEFGADGIELSVAAELDYDDPTEDQTDALELLLEDCLERTPGAQVL